MRVERPRNLIAWWSVVRSSLCPVAWKTGTLASVEKDLREVARKKGWIVLMDDPEEGM